MLLWVGDKIYIYEADQLVADQLFEPFNGNIDHYLIQRANDKQIPLSVKTQEKIAKKARSIITELSTGKHVGSTEAAFSVEFLFLFNDKKSLQQFINSSSDKIAMRKKSLSLLQTPSI